MRSKDTTRSALDFGQLIGAIRQVHDELAAQASRAVNANLTLRNWMIGFHVEEYERRGVDRAAYGDKLMDALADSLTQLGVSRCDRREIYRYRRFYLTYLQIVGAVTPQLQPLINQSLLAGTAAAAGAVTPVNVEPTLPFRNHGKTLISRLSFTHIVEFLNLEDATERIFYEVECIQGNWSVRETSRGESRR